MELFIIILMILAIINESIAGPKKTIALKPLELSHEERVSSESSESRSTPTERKAKILKIIGSSPKERDEMLSQVYAFTKSNEPRQEERMYEKLLEIHPKLWNMNSDIIRSVVHDWYRKNSGELVGKQHDWPRQHVADLLYILNQVRHGQDPIEEKIERKWMQMNPDSDHFSKFTLLRKAYHFSHSDFVPTLQEMEEAKKKYNMITAPKQGGILIGKPKVKWTKELKADLLHIYKVYMEQKSHGMNPWQLWRRMHPELSFLTKKNLDDQHYTMNRKEFEISPEDEVAAAIRFEKSAELGETSHSRATEQ